MSDVRVLTRNAEVDDLTPDDYREMFDEVRGFDPATGEAVMSLGKFVALSGSPLSKGNWSRYQRGEIELTRPMRNDLRRIVGKPELPPTVEETMAQHVDGNAEVVKVGEALAGRVILLATKLPLTIHANGRVTASHLTPAPSPHGEGNEGAEALQSAAMGEETQAGGKGHVRRRTRALRRRIALPARTFDALNVVRERAGLTWEALAQRVITDLGSELDIERDGETDGN